MFTREEIEEAGFFDFRNFLAEVWKHLGLPAPTPVQLSIAWTLQYGDAKSVIEAFRGVGKSWITVSFVIWTLLLDPQKKVMVVSASEKHAINFSTFCKQLINEMPILAHLRPGIGQRDSNESFDVGPARSDLSPSVKSVGITGQLTGSRADLIVPDDIETPKNSYTHVQRERLAELIKEFSAVLKPEGEIKYLGTPQVEYSVYNRLPGRGYTIYVWPSEIPENPDAYNGKLSKYITDLIDKGAQPHEPVEPSRFNREVLADKLAEYGKGGYALQFMLDTAPSSGEKNPLKLSDLMIDDVDTEMAPVRMIWSRDRQFQINDLAPGGLEGDVYYAPSWRSDERAKWSGTCMAIDPSGRGSDETAYAVVRLLHSQLYLVASGGFTDGFSEETLKKLAGIAAQYSVNGLSLVVEENYGGGMFVSLLQPYLIKACAAVNKARKEERRDPPRSGVRIEEDVWHSKQKELRILDTLEPIVQTHKLVIDRRVIEADILQQQDNPRYSLIQQFSRMERTKGALANEDRLEALQMACEFFVENMKQDQEKAEQTHKDKLLEEELRKFKHNAINTGRKSAGPRPLTYSAFRARR